MKVLISVSVSPKDKIFNEIFNQESQWWQSSAEQGHEKGSDKSIEVFLETKVRVYPFQM